MKVMWTLKPLAFAVAAGLAVTATAQEVPPPTTPGSSALATVSDTQSSAGNYVLNQGTVNTGSLESSLDDAAGNVGVNIAGGDHNQQANSAALSTADEFFVFGTATAAVNLSQTGTNVVDNYSVTNTASVLNSGNNASGNIGINVASGVFNQQKNDFATATSGGFVATASSTATQSSTGNITNNRAVLTESAVVALTLNGNVTGTYEGISDQVGDVYLEVWNSPLHPNGTTQLGHVDVDSDNQGAQPGPNGTGSFLFEESGEIDLAGTLTGTVPLVSLQQAVNNSATVSGSLNGASGNVGLNVAAGSGNQQSNSLAIAAGCNACSGNGGTPTGL